MRIKSKAEPRGTRGHTGELHKAPRVCPRPLWLGSLLAPHDETLMIGKPASLVKLDTRREFVRIALPSIS